MNAGIAALRVASSRRGLVAAALASAALLVPGAARAAQTYFTTEQLLRAFFPASERVTFRRVAIDPELRARLSQRLGYTPARPEYVIFVALSGARVDGYAVIDDEPGQHEPITFGVKLSPTAIVERQEVMVYREGYGGEVADPRFRAQFVGKGSRDALRAGDDVDVIAGATISSRAMAAGVRRAVALVEELLRKGAS